MIRFLIAGLVVSLAGSVFAETPAEMYSAAYDAAYTANANCYDSRGTAESGLYDASAVRAYAVTAREEAVNQGATDADLAVGDALFAAGDVSASFAIRDLWCGHSWLTTAEPYWLNGLLLFWLGSYDAALANFTVSTPAYEEAIRNYNRSAVWFNTAGGDFQNAEYAFWTAYYQQ